MSEYLNAFVANKSIKTEIAKHNFVNFDELAIWNGMEINILDLAVLANELDGTKFKVRDIDGEYLLSFNKVINTTNISIKTNIKFYNVEGFSSDQFKSEAKTYLYALLNTKELTIKGNTVIDNVSSLYGPLLIIDSNVSYSTVSGSDIRCSTVDSSIVRGVMFSGVHCKESVVKLVTRLNNSTLIRANINTNYDFACVKFKLGEFYEHVGIFYTNSDNTVTVYVDNLFMGDFKHKDDVKARLKEHPCEGTVNYAMFSKMFYTAVKMWFRK